MPRNTRKGRPDRNTRSIAHLEKLIANPRDAGTPLPVNSRDVVKEAEDRLKRADTSSVIRAHTKKSLELWSKVNAPKRSQEFWQDTKSEVARFYIATHCSGLAVAAHCVVQDLFTKEPDEKLGQVFSPARQESARLMTELLISTTGDIELVKALEEPLPSNLKIWSTEQNFLYSSYDSRPTETYADPEMRLASYDIGALHGLARTVRPHALVVMGNIQIPGTKM